MNKGILMSGRLTKKFLMQAPTGAYIVSNLCDNKKKPLFAEKVSALAKREMQWKKIVQTSVDQRQCYVYKTKKDYEKIG